MSIVSTIRPPITEGGSDRLIFSPNENGQFSVKKAYAGLLNNQTAQEVGSQVGVQSDLSRLWKHIWKAGDLPPRICLFLWKLTHGAVPLSKTMFTRLRRGDPVCQMCGQADEDEMHLAFQCHFSRACWLAGSLAIRTGAFQSSIKEAMLAMMELVPAELWQEVAMALWAIWRCRNDLVFQAKTPSFKTFNTYTSLIRSEITLATSHASLKTVQSGISSPQLNYQSTICNIDGSWIVGWMGGIGFVLQQEGSLIAYKTERVLVCCPLQAEAMALLQGVDFVISQGLLQCTFLTDNLTLAEACTAQGPPMEVDWRAHKEIFEVWKKFKVNSGFNCCHVGRSDNSIADQLARRGTKTGESYMGFTYPTFLK